MQFAVSNDDDDKQGVVYAAVIMASCHERSPSSFDECRLSVGWPPTLRPSQLTWALTLLVKAATIHIHHRH